MSVPRDPEAFLRQFHRDHPGCTSIALGRGRLADGRSSYQALAAAVPIGARTLDLGCGDGHLLAALRAREPGAALVGLDLSADELAVASTRAIPGVALIHGRAPALPFVDGAFDACVSHLASMLMPDPVGLAVEVARVLAPGGQLAIVTGGGPLATPDAYGWFLDALFATADRADIPRCGDRRSRDPVELAAMWAAAGLHDFSWTRAVLDLSGTVDDVWASLALTYDVAPLTATQRADLRDRFAARCAAEVAPGAPVPCAMVLGFAHATRA